MLSRSERETFVKAISKYGERNQLIVFFEEMSELQKEVCKSIRYKASKSIVSHIAEELADVEIMLDQVKLIFGITDDDIEGWRLEKIVRLRERLGLAPQFAHDKEEEDAV